MIKIFHPRKLSSSPAPSRQSRSKLVDSFRALETIVEVEDFNMDPDTIFKALRPLPEFDGNPNVLTRFIRLCDQLCAAYLSAEPGRELTNLCLLNGILNKITGPAARTINSNGIPESWEGIRNALVNNFSDQRDETALYNDLSLATQGNSSPQEFYDHCQNLFSTIMTYVSLHEVIPTTIEAKRTLYKKLTMQAFVRGLKEPLGSRIRCMRPDSAEKALEFVQEELNVMYLQQRNDSVKVNASPKPMQLQSFSMPVQKSFVPPAPMYNMPFNAPLQRPMPQFHPPQPWKPNFPMNRPPQGPSRTQQMFRALPPNYNPHHNSFRVVPRNQQPTTQNTGPKPMSGVSHYVTRPLPPTQPRLSGHDWMKSGNPPPSNYFKTRDINLNECYDYEGYNDYYQGCDSYSYYPECEYTYECPSVEYEEPQYYTDYNVTEQTDNDNFNNHQPSTSNPDQDFQKGSISRKSK